MLLNRNRSELHFFSSYERLICSEELGSRHQTPTLIGCMLLTIPAVTPALRLRFPLNPAAISEALDYDRFWRVPSNSVASAASLAVCRLASARVVGEDSHCSTLVAFSSRLDLIVIKEH